MLDNNKCILIYGLEEEEKKVIDNINDNGRLGKVVEITNTMASMVIGDIISGLKLELVGKKLPEEKVIIFNNLSDDELNTTIKSIRTLLESKPILAVVTPTSIKWTFAALLEHLIEERRLFRLKQKRGE